MGKGVLETYKEKVGTNQKTRTFVRCLVCQEFHDEIRYLSRANRIYIADGVRCSWCTLLMVYVADGVRC